MASQEANSSMEQLAQSLAPPEIIVDGEIILRQYNVKDVHQVYELVDNNRDHLSEFLGWAKFYTEDEALVDAKEALKQIELAKQASYEIIFNGEIVGAVNLYGREGECSEMGYWLAEAAQGKGILTRSAGALLKFGFEQWGLREVLLDINPANHKSLALLRRLGAKPISKPDVVSGVMKPVMTQTWSITR